MITDLPGLLEKARSGSFAALQKLRALKEQGVDLPPAALTLVQRKRPMASHGASEDDLVEVGTVAAPREQLDDSLKP